MTPPPRTGPGGHDASAAGERVPPRPAPDGGGSAFLHGLRARLRADERAIVDAVLVAAEPWGVDHDEAALELVRCLTRWFLGGGSSWEESTQRGADQLREAGAHYAVLRVPLGGARDEFRRSLIEISRRAWEFARPADSAELLDLVRVFEAAVGTAEAAFDEGYRIRFAASGNLPAHRRRLAEVVLAGHDPERRLLLAAGVAPAERYCVLVTGVPRPSRTAEEIVLRMPVRDVLTRQDDGRLVVLAPLPRRSTAETVRSLVDGFFTGLAAATGARVAGVCVADPAEVPAAVRRARETHDAAVVSGRTGAVRDADLVIERALAGSADARRELAGLLRRLSETPHLLHTLHVLYACDLDRTRAAAALHIARRSLGKRLDRIEQITGIRPTSARGVQVLASALAIGPAGGGPRPAPVDRAGAAPHRTAPVAHRRSPGTARGTRPRPVPRSSPRTVIDRRSAAPPPQQVVVGDPDIPATTRSSHQEEDVR